MEKTTIQLLQKDKDYFEKLRKKKRKTGMWAIIESIVEMMKRLKLEEELK